MPGAHRVVAQVDDGGARRQRLAGAPRQRQAREFSAQHVLQRLERRRRGAEHHRSTGALRAQDGEVARRIAEAAFVLLERGVVFLVDDDEAEIRDRREHRGARAEHDARLAGHALPPGGETLGVGERGVQHGDRHREALAEAPDELRREPDLRHQHQRALAAPQRSLDGVQVDLGLAAAGDAVQQEGRETRVRGVDGRNGGGLFFAQRRARAAQQVGAGRFGRRGVGIFGRRREAARHQRAHRRAPVAECSPRAPRWSRLPAHAGLRAARAGAVHA